MAKYFLGLCFIFLLGQNQIYAQVYFHTPDSNAVWNVVDVSWAPNSGFSNSQIRISGDSTINGKVYHILKMDNHYLLSAYREDVNKKVYLVPFYQANQTLNIFYMIFH